MDYAPPAKACSIWRRGGVNTAFGLAFYPALLLASDWLYRHYMMALLIAQFVCTLFSFVNFKLFVFRTRGGGTA